MYNFTLPPPPSESLPCTVRIAESICDLTRAANLRRDAYMRHVPEFAASLDKLEPADLEDDTIVFIAESKDDGRPVGTLRLHANAGRTLPVERSVNLSSRLSGAALAEATRLAVEPGQMGRHARNALFKACYLQSLAWKTEWIVATARHPLDRIYESLMFVDLLGEGRTILMAHVGNMPHRVYGLQVATADDVWFSRGHSLYSYMTKTFHRDIAIDQIRTQRIFRAKQTAHSRI
jgi:hypothetical protein